MTTTRLARRLTCYLQGGSIKNHYMREHRTTPTRRELEEGTVILDHDNDARRLPLLEALYIKDLSPSINIQGVDLQILPSGKELEGHPTACTLKLS